MVGSQISPKQPKQTMKKTKQLIAIILCASLVGCATLQNIQKILGTPAAVQTELTILGAALKSRIPADAQTRIHGFALHLQSVSNLDLTALFALIPTTGSQNGDALIASAKAYLTATVQKYGASNPTTIAYARAVAAGLLANF